MTKPTGLFAALSFAQMEMGKAVKDSTNPVFKSKYADLASVMDACMPALNKHGIAVIQPVMDDETGRYVKTILIHGETGETAECRVPLIVQKNDMQGYGSAVTYGRRYGLMCMAGIAPEDDDGNAAAKAAPTGPTSAHMKRCLADLDRDLADANTEVAVDSLARAWKAKMHNEGWPDGDEHSFLDEVKRRFALRRQYLESITPVEDEPQAQQARERAERNLGYHENHGRAG